MESNLYIIIEKLTYLNKTSLLYKRNLLYK